MIKIELHKLYLIYYRIQLNILKMDKCKKKEVYIDNFENSIVMRFLNILCNNESNVYKEKISKN